MGFDVDGGEEGEDAEREGDGDVWGVPAGGGVSGFRDGEDGEGEAGDDGDGASIVHLCGAGVRLGWCRAWDRKD